MSNQKMRGVYLIPPSVEKGTASPGVIKKIESQIRVFEDAGFEMRRYPTYNDMSIKGKIARRMPFSNAIDCWNYLYSFKDIDFVYFRKPLSMNWAFRKYLRWIKKQNPNIELIMEIPTYPYDEELLARHVDFPLYLYDLYGRKLIKKRIDRISILTDDSEIFGVKAIHFKNGFDFSKVRQVKKEYQRERIDFCCVAEFAFWHGYDRLIRGVSDYYKNSGSKDVFIHMIGNGSELEKLKELVNDLEIEDRFKFYGRVESNQLMELYDLCDVGIGDLGGYRKKSYYSCAIKNKEYIAVGLPLVVGGKCDVSKVKELSKYVYTALNDESNINIKEIIDFYENLAKEFNYDLNEMHSVIRDLSKKEFAWDVAMQNVVEYIRIKSPRITVD